jgi:hypothetical protein
MSESQSHRPARSTRAAAPVYAEHAAAAARAKRAHAQPEEESWKAEALADDTDEQAATLQFAEDVQIEEHQQLVQHTRKQLQWQEEEEAGDGMQAATATNEVRAILRVACIMYSNRISFCLFPFVSCAMLSWIPAVWRPCCRHCPLSSVDLCTRWN